MFGDGDSIFECFAKLGVCYANLEVCEVALH
jgi:hypothetical protein